MATILITGGTGIIGSALIPKLKEKGHEIRILSRSRKDHPHAKVFTWDIDEETIKDGALNEIDHIIHLAGYNVSEGRWTENRKQLIKDSRIKSVAVIKKHLGDQKIKSFISASGISIYGVTTSEQIFEEDTEVKLADNDFLGKVSVEWEKAADLLDPNTERTVILRTPVVLSYSGGALEKISAPIKKGFGTALGNGKQWMPWVHINDLVNAYFLALENESLSGTFNVCAPEHVNNKTFTKTCAKVLGKKIWMPNAPGFILRLYFGAMAGIVLEGSRVSGEKITQHGFEYQFKALEPAIEDLFRK